MYGWKIAYEKYIASPQWQDKRRQAFALYGRKCKHCGAKKELQVHHKTYANLFNERMEDLEIACKKCHMAIHARVVTGKPKTKGPRTLTHEQKAKKEREAELRRLIGLHNAEIRAARKNKKKPEVDSHRPGDLLRFMSNNRGPAKIRGTELPN